MDSLPPSLYSILKDPVTSPAVPEQDACRWAFRLVNLSPGRLQDPIACQLVTSTVGRMRDQYEALSYTWGDAEDRTEAIVDGCTIQVTKNLDMALRHMRLEEENRMLWVDALCINQSDMAEVSTQVQRMWAIFESATRVLVFLGPKDGGSDEAFALLSRLSTIPVRLGHEDITAMLNDARLATSWQALLRLMQRPWWRRAWVVQEYTVARQVVFICGRSELENETFGTALEVLVDYRFNAIIRPDHHRLVRRVAATPTHHLWSTRQTYQNSEPASRPDAADVVYRFRGHQALDPRDKIYSLYRLMAEHPKLGPDYTKSAVQLYLDVVKVMIETSGTLEVLSHHNRNVRGLEGLPTWCPDWTILRGKRILLWPNHYRAAGSTDEPAFFRIENKTLTLRGRILDRVRWLRAFESDEFDNPDRIYQEFRDVLEPAARPLFGPGRGGDDDDDAAAFDDAFRRTLVAARVRMHGPSRAATALGPGDAAPLWAAWSAQRAGGPGDAGRAKRYGDALYSALSGRAFVVTEGGALGLVDGTVRRGDALGVFAGGRVPLALRACGRDAAAGAPRPCYELVGEWCVPHTLDIASGRLLTRETRELQLLGRIYVWGSF